MVSALWVIKLCHLVSSGGGERREETQSTLRLFSKWSRWNHVSMWGRFMDSRSLIRDCGRHQLVDLGAVVRHADDEEGLVVWRWESEAETLEMSASSHLS